MRLRPNQWLLKMFDEMNYNFFNCRIPKSTTVSFAKIKHDGVTKYNRGVSTILIHRDLIKHPDLAAIILLHEMNHADLHVSGYTGYEHLNGHSTLFHAGIDRIYRQGAYESLL
jgi:hypothetical protein